MRTRIILLGRFLCRTNLNTMTASNTQMGGTRSLSSPSSPVEATKEKVKVTFIKQNEERITVHANQGDNLLDVVINNDIDLDGFGACEGTLACSTCHLIFKKEDYDKLNEKPTDEELDMLDLAYELTDTSRLGCQVYLTKALDGLEAKVPEGINDQRADDM